MAKKIYLHLPTAYSQYATLNPSVALAEARKMLLAEYKEKANSKMTVNGTAMGGHGSKEAALELQNFLQSLKQYGNDNEISQSLADQIDQQVIMDVADAALKGRSKKIFATMYFGKKNGAARKQGVAFEAQLAQVVAIVNAMVAGEDPMNRNIVRRGAKLANIGTKGTGIAQLEDLQNSVEEFSKEYIKKVPSALNEVFGLKKSDNVLVNRKPVEAKTDVTGKTLDWTYSSEASPYLKRIATLLSQASFSAKSSRSVTKIYEDKISRIVQKEFSKLKFKIGDTDMNRIVVDIFNSVGYPPIVSVALLHALSNKAKYDDQIKADLSTIRFIYELTGRGQTYIDEAMQDIMTEEDIQPGANYLVFNDPATNAVYVRSTADIINELYEKMTNVFYSKLYLYRSTVFGSVE